jgi:hypothetical protein
MVLAYRSNPTPPKPFIQSPEPEFIPRATDDYSDWRARTLPFKRANVEAPSETDLQQADIRPASKEVIQMATRKKKVIRNGRKKGATGPGVIATIIEMISRDRGASAAEILAKLVENFPDREEAGMHKTIIIQCNRHCSSKEMDEKRGRVYHKRR